MYAAFEKEGVCEHSENGGEGVERLGHVGLKVVRCRLGPDSVAHEVGNERTTHDDCRYLEEGMESSFFHYAARRTD